MQPPPPDPRDAKQYYLAPTRLNRLTVVAANLFFPLISKIRVEGLENIPTEGPAILAANHLNALDAAILGLKMPRRVLFMAKSELFNHRFADTFLRHNGSFPVKREEFDPWAMKKAMYVLEQGTLLGIFPEGYVSHERVLLPGKIGAALLARRVGCPIIPVAITGSFDLFRKLPKRAHITLQVGTPLHSQTYDTAQTLTDRVMYALADMLPLSHRGSYSEPSHVLCE